MLQKSMLALLPGDQLISMGLQKVGATSEESDAVAKFFSHLKGSFLGSFMPDTPGTLAKMMLGGTTFSGPAGDLLSELTTFPGVKHWLQQQIDRLVSSFPQANDIVSLVEKLQSDGLAPQPATPDESIGSYVASLLARSADEQAQGETYSHVAHVCPSCNFAHIVNF